MGALGGLIALPFYDEWRKLFDEDPATWLRSKLDTPWMRNLSTFGIFGLAGTDASGSLGMETPKTLGDLLGVPYAFVEDTKNMLTDIRLGDYYRAIADSPATPMIVRNAMNGYRLYSEGQTARTGRPISMTPKSKEGDKISGLATVGKALGFQPISVSKGRLASRVSIEAGQSKSEAQSAFASRQIRAERAKKSGDVLKVKRELAEYNKEARAKGQPQILNPDYQASLRALRTGRSPSEAMRAFTQRTQKAWE
jgi:hypothetical protein